MMTGNKPQQQFGGQSEPNAEPARPFRRRVQTGLALFAAVVLSGCGSVCLTTPDIEVGIVADADANRFTAIAIDIVATENDRTAARLNEMTAANYFQQRDQIIRDNPETLTVRSWELVPGQAVEPDDVNYGCDVKGIYIFASYVTPGIHRLRITPGEDITINLLADEFEVVQ